MAAPSTTKSLGSIAMKRSTSGSTLVDSGVTTPVRTSLDTTGNLEHLNLAFGLHTVDSHKLPRYRALIPERKTFRISIINFRRITGAKDKTRGASTTRTKDFGKKVCRGIKTAGHCIKETLSEQ